MGMSLAPAEPPGTRWGLHNPDIARGPAGSLQSGVRGPFRRAQRQPTPRYWYLSPLHRRKLSKTSDGDAGVRKCVQATPSAYDTVTLAMGSCASVIGQIAPPGG